MKLYWNSKSMRTVKEFVRNSEYSPKFKSASNLHFRPQSCDPFGQRRGSRALAGARITRKCNSFPLMVTVIFFNFWGCAESRKSVIHELSAPVPPRSLVPWRWPEGSQLWGREWSILQNAWNLTFFHVFNMFVTLKLVSGLHWLSKIWQLRQGGLTDALGEEFKFLRRRCKLSLHFPLLRAPTPERACSQAS